VFNLAPALISGLRLCYSLWWKNTFGAHTDGVLIAADIGSDSSELSDSGEVSIDGY